MARRVSLGEQFRATIGRNVIFALSKNILATMHDAARELCDSFIKYAVLSNMSFITGNAYRSFTVGIYENGKLVDIVTTEDDDPTMKTLREGQAYPLDRYYDGTPIEASLGRYVGRKGSGGQWGPTLGPARIRKLHPKSRARWQMLVICPVEYAPFCELNHIHNTLCALSDALPGIFFGKVAYVKALDENKTISLLRKYT